MLFFEKFHGWNTRGTRPHPPLRDIHARKTTRTNCLLSTLFSVSCDVAILTWVRFRVILPEGITRGTRIFSGELISFERTQDALKYLKGMLCIGHIGWILLILHRNAARKRNNFNDHATSQSVSRTSPGTGAPLCIIRLSIADTSLVLWITMWRRKLEGEKNFSRFTSEELISRRRRLSRLGWNGFVTRSRGKSEWNGSASEGHLICEQKKSVKLYTLWILLCQHNSPGDNIFRYHFVNCHDYRFQKGFLLRYTVECTDWRTILQCKPSEDAVRIGIRAIILAAAVDAERRRPSHNEDNARRLRIVAFTQHPSTLLTYPTSHALFIKDQLHFGSGTYTQRDHPLQRPSSPPPAALTRPSVGVAVRAIHS